MKFLIEKCKCFEQKFTEEYYGKKDLPTLKVIHDDFLAFLKMMKELADTIKDDSRDKYFKDVLLTRTKYFQRITKNFYDVIFYRKPLKLLPL